MTSKEKKLLIKTNPDLAYFFRMKKLCDIIGWSLLGTSSGFSTMAKNSILGRSSSISHNDAEILEKFVIESIKNKKELEKLKRKVKV